MACRACQGEVNVFCHCVLSFGKLGSWRLQALHNYDFYVMDYTQHAVPDVKAEEGKSRNNP